MKEERVFEFIIGSRGSGKTMTTAITKHAVKNVVSDILKMFDNPNYKTKEELKQTIIKRYRFIIEE